MSTVLLSGSKFMSALAQDGAVNEEQLSVEQLDRVYGQLRQQVADSVHRQEAALDQIQVVIYRQRVQQRNCTNIDCAIALD